MSEVRRIIAFSLIGLGGVLVVLGVVTPVLLLLQPPEGVWATLVMGFCCSSTFGLPGVVLIVVGRRVLYPGGRNPDPAPPIPGRDVPAAHGNETLRPTGLNDLMRFNALGWTLGGLTAVFTLAGISLIVWFEQSGRLGFNPSYLVVLLLAASWLFFHGGRLLLKRLGWSIYRW